jgi:hypothetical protein
VHLQERTGYLAPLGYAQEPWQAEERGEDGRYYPPTNQSDMNHLVNDEPHPHKNYQLEKTKSSAQANILCIISGAKFSNNIGELRIGSPRSCPKIA